MSGIFSYFCLGFRCGVCRVNDRNMLSRVLYGFVWLFSLLPLGVLYLFSDLCYVVLYYVVGYRRKVVRMNLEHSFPEKSAAERKGIEKRFYRHLCDMFVESYRMWHMSREEMERRCVFHNKEAIQHYLDEGRSVIVVLGHYGNWEWMASYGLNMSPGVDFFTLYKPLHSPLLDRMMREIRSRFGAKPVPKNDVLRAVVGNRREGRLFLAAFIGDQTPNKDNLNFWTDFLNQDTPVLVGTEKVARKFDLPVVSLRTRKVKRGYYEVDIFDLCGEPNRLESGELTRMHTGALEKYIRETPELWLWSHRRWKHKRESHDN